MFNILTLNKISKVGLKNFDSEKFIYSDKIQNPDAVIVRSASMHETPFPDNLLAVARAGAGVNNIPIDKCTQKGICVFNTPGANANAVKELVICALFLASRKIVSGSKWCDTLKGHGGDVPKLIEKGKSNYAGPEIFGKTLGIIGLGAIGIKVANAASALGMKVIGYDPFISEDAASTLGGNIRLTVDLDEIFTSSDYITLHTPITEKTKGIINKESLKKTHDGIRILNFARGELVDNNDIIEALTTGKCAAYATDFPTDAQLSVDGVIAIPHLGASTPEAEDNCAVMAVQELSDYLLLGNVNNSVNFPALKLDKTAKFRLTAVTHDDKTKELENSLSASGIHVNGKASALKKDVGYAIFDVDCEITEESLSRLKKIDGVKILRLI